MRGPGYGALGATFVAVRALQAISLIGIIGMTANFVSEIVQADVVPQNIILGNTQCGMFETI